MDRYRGGRAGATMAAALAFLVVFSAVAFGDGELTGTTRIKDITTIKDVYENKLVGKGIVVGLQGTGEKNPDAVRSMKNFFNAMVEEDYPVDINIKTGNAASVLVEATLPAFARVGQKIDVQVSSFGDASSLAGGRLILAEMKPGPGLPTYAIASGSILIGDLTQPGGTATVGDVLGGGMVVRETTSEFIKDGRVTLLLNEPDFDTAYKIVKGIEEQFMLVERPDRDGEEETIARATDLGQVEVTIPAKYRRDPVQFIRRIQNVTISVPASAARVVINARTGTIAIGNEVRITPTHVSHKGVDVSIESETTVKEMTALWDKAALQPADRIAILRVLKRRGALHAELVPM